MKSIAVLTLFLLLAACGANPRRAEPVKVAEPEAVEPTPQLHTNVAATAKPCALPDEGFWSTFQGRPDRTGAVDAPAIAWPVVRWNIKVGTSTQYSGLLVVGNRVFVGSAGSVVKRADGGDGIHALDAKTGESDWFTWTAADVNGMAYARCRIIATNDSGTVFAITADKGDAVWQHHSPSQTNVVSHPLIIGDRIFVADTRGNIVALDFETGKLLWNAEIDPDGAFLGGPATDGKLLYIASTNGLLVAVQPDDGTVVWKVETKARIEATPTVVNGLVIVPQHGPKKANLAPMAAAFDAATGAKKWVLKNPRKFKGGWGNPTTSYAVVGDNFFWADPASNRVIAASLQTGEVQWSLAQGACYFHNLASVVSANGTLYVGRHGGGVYGIDASAAEPSWARYLGRRGKNEFPSSHTESGWDRCRDNPTSGSYSIRATPAIGPDGTLYVTSAEGYLYAIGQNPQVQTEQPSE